MNEAATALSAELWARIVVAGGSCAACMQVPEAGGRCDKCGTNWQPDERGTLQQASRYGSLELCDLCDGTGDYGEWYCPDCKGTGVIWDDEGPWRED